MASWETKSSKNLKRSEHAVSGERNRKDHCYLCRPCRTGHDDTMCFVGTTASIAFLSGLASLFCGIFCNVPLIICAVSNDKFLTELGYNNSIPLDSDHVPSMEQVNSFASATFFVFFVNLVYLGLITLLVRFRLVTMVLFVIPLQIRVGVNFGLGIYLGKVALDVDHLGLWNKTAQGQEVERFNYKNSVENSVWTWFTILSISLVIILLQYRKLKTFALLAVAVSITVISNIVKLCYFQSLYRNVTAENFTDDLHSWFLYKFMQIGWPSLEYLREHDFAIVYACINLLASKAITTITVILAMAHIQVSSNKLLASHDWDEVAFSRQMSSSTSISRIMLVDAFFSCLSPMFGLPSARVVIQSFIAYQIGATTGLSAVVCGLLCLLSPFFQPQPVYGSKINDWLIPPYVTGLLLLCTVVPFFEQVRSIKFTDFRHSLPLIIAALALPLTGSYSLGFSVGFVVYFCAALFDGSMQEQLQIATGSPGALTEGRIVSSLPTGLPIAGGGDEGGQAPYRGGSLSQIPNGTVSPHYSNYVLLTDIPEGSINNIDGADVNPAEVHSRCPPCPFPRLIPQPKTALRENNPYLAFVFSCAFFVLAVLDIIGASMPPENT